MGCLHFWGCLSFLGYLLFAMFCVLMWFVFYVVRFDVFCVVFCVLYFVLCFIVFSVLHCVIQCFAFCCVLCFVVCCASPQSPSRQCKNFWHKQAYRLQGQMLICSATKKLQWDRLLMKFFVKICLFRCLSGRVSSHKKYQIILCPKFSRSILVTHPLIFNISKMS